MYLEAIAVVEWQPEQLMVIGDVTILGNEGGCRHLDLPRVGTASGLPHDCPSPLSQIPI
ncbi:conserved hypothetical protein [Ricinus communis]|uniref:Uncharacterized protein n=1 Tax=Ricinus communis TaxID=3988 RepID=B9T4B8_RICCO|nr:conserved hypothetical protein [Ricinus communis]